MDSALPDMQLSSTAAYFVKRLSDADQKSLEARMKHLDGTTIRVGSTCSGTDLRVPVLKHTFKRLSLLYNVKVEVEHVFSVESQGYKRSFIAEAHHEPTFRGHHSTSSVMLLTSKMGAGTVTHAERTASVCVCVFMHMYIRVHTHTLYVMYVCMYCMYVCMYVCIYVCMYVCMYACMYVAYRNLLYCRVPIIKQLLIRTYKER